MWCTILQCVGSLVHGTFKDQYSYFAIQAMQDVSRLALTGTSLICLAVSWEDFHSNPGLKIVFACTGFFRWSRVLNTLKGFERFGKPMLPIVQAIPATVPFFLVVFFWLMGFLHVYYSLGFREKWDAATMMYRLGFLGDFSMTEMHSRSLRKSGGAPGTAEDDALQAGNFSSDDAWWGWYVDALVLTMSISMSIVLMNILIGVLSESYNTGWASRERLFFLERSRVVLQHFIMNAGREKLCPCRKRAKLRASHVDTMQEETWDYVWYARPRDASEWGTDNNDFSEHMNMHERMNEMRRVVYQMQETSMNNKKSWTTSWRR